MLSLQLFLLTVCALVSCSRHRRKHRCNSSSSDSLISPLSTRELSSSRDSLDWNENEEPYPQVEQCRKISLNILALFKGVIKKVEIWPMMQVEANQILYMLLDSSMHGHVQKPLRAQFTGVISTVYANREETLVQRGQILAEIVVLVCTYQQQSQGHKQALQNRKNTSANQGSRGSSRRTSESSQSMSEQEREYRAWKEYCKKYPHHRFC